MQSIYHLPFSERSTRGMTGQQAVCHPLHFEGLVFRTALSGLGAQLNYDCGVETGAEEKPTEGRGRKGGGCLTQEKASAQG